jgi:MFS family permease
MFFVAIAGAFMPNFILYTAFRYSYRLSIIRIILVMCVGFMIPISFSMLAENTPIK